MNDKNINETLLKQFNQQLETLTNSNRYFEDIDRQIVDAIGVLEQAKKLFEHQAKINAALYDMILLLPGRSQEKLDKIAELDH